MASAERFPAAPERDLAVLLRGLRPQLQDGEWVFVTVARPPDVEPLASFAEDEGLSLVVRREQADAAGLAYHFVAAWITCTVHSALDAVGLPPPSPGSWLPPGSAATSSPPRKGTAPLSERSLAVEGRAVSHRRSS